MKTIITLLLACTLSTNIFCQDAGMENRELLVEKEYSNEIYDVNPIFNYASIYTPQRSSLSFDSDTLIRTNPFTPDINVFIRPVTYQTPKQLSGHKGFVKLDKGTVNPLHAQAGYSYSAANYFNVHGTFNFDSRKEALIENKTIKNINASLGMDYYLTNEIKTDISLSYAKDNFGLYGYDQILAGQELTNTIGYSLTKASLGFTTFKTSPDQWNFSLRTNIAQWSDIQTDNKELNIGIKGEIEFRINSTWGMSLSPQFKDSRSESLGDQSIVKTDFQISHNASKFYANTGATANYFDDKFQFWPKLDLRWNVAHNAHINVRSDAMATILGGQYIRSINPYQGINQLSNSDKTFTYQRNISIDIQSEIVEDLDFEVKIGYLNAIGDLNFRNSFKDFRIFQFDQVDYQLLSMSFDVRKKVFGPMLSAGLKLQYDNYANFNTTLFNRPSFIVTPLVESRLFKQKLHLKLTGLINNPQIFDSIPALITHSSWRKNFSFGLTYNVTDQLNINLNADNIINDEYQVWNGYNNFGRNLSGGLLVKF